VTRFFDDPARQAFVRLDRALYKRIQAGKMSVDIVMRADRGSQLFLSAAICWLLFSFAVATPC